MSNQVSTRIQAEAIHELEIDMPPGTELMRDTTHIHLTKSHNSVLVPQPSNDINDPLNWSKKWKFILMVGQFLTAMVHQIGGLSVAPQVPYYMETYDRSLNDVLNFIGIYIITTGLSTIFWVGASTKVGRRPILLTSCGLGIFVALWRALATSYRSQMAAAAIHGIASGPAQTVSGQLVSDVMFLHERGLYMGLFSFAFFAAMTIGPVIAGVMSERYGWRSFWWLDFGLYIFLFVWTLFLIPETKWNRSNNVMENSPDGVTEVSVKGSVDNSIEKVTSLNEDIIIVDEFLYKGSPSRKQFGISHLDRTARKRDMLRPFWVPFKLFFFPIVLWAGFVYSGSASIFLVVNLTQSDNFAASPYNFSSSSVGFTNFATLGGIFIGLVTSGPLSDWLCRWSTKRNNGIREPEMRLPALIPFALCQLLGIVIIALGYEYKWKWPIIVIIGYGLVGIQVASVTTIAATYAVDGYRAVTGDIFVLASLIKDLYAYGLSKWLPTWIQEVGYKTPILVALAVAFIPILLGVLLYFFGKSLRKLSRNSFVHDF
ncbi:Hol1p [Sugiyamaella lignohabitans]|uniref:Hol1p n=1 Tax=Sugiyamaella lignohabitans TaxID=796027 RepID=A0A167FD19_9ASCO|nr:Hol1p [Sugiyamaella lignohabitans]ANB15141.1 Hol1p [Sugiyamaella lignohabitans]